MMNMVGEMPEEDGIADQESMVVRITNAVRADRKVIAYCDEESIAIAGISEWLL